MTTRDTATYRLQAVSEKLLGFINNKTWCQSYPLIAANAKKAIALLSCESVQEPTKCFDVL
eukprot:1574556-Pyramimonas_sp.AAC.1